jgi:hypothetical protein
LAQAAIRPQKQILPPPAHHARRYGGGDSQLATHKRFLHLRLLKNRVRLVPASRGIYYARKANQINHFSKIISEYFRVNFAKSFLWSF